MTKKSNSTKGTEGNVAAPAAAVRAVSPELDAQVDEALGLQAISIRLHKSTIDTYKALAKMHGVGYQPLMRDALSRWAEGEMKQMLIAAAEAQKQHEASVPTVPTKRAA